MLLEQKLEGWMEEVSGDERRTDSRPVISSGGVVVDLSSGVLVVFVLVFDRPASAQSSAGDVGLLERLDLLS